MLINQFGVEDDSVVNLDTRRAITTPDPKNRVSLTTLLQIALSPVPRFPLEVPPAADAPITTLSNTTDASSTEEGSSRSDVA